MEYEYKLQVRDQTWKQFIMYVIKGMVHKMPYPKGKKLQLNMLFKHRPQIPFPKIPNVNLTTPAKVKLRQTHDL